MAPFLFLSLPSPDVRGSNLFEVSFSERSRYPFAEERGEGGGGHLLGNFFNYSGLSEVKGIKNFSLFSRSKRPMALVRGGGRGTTTTLPKRH